MDQPDNLIVPAGPITSVRVSNGLNNYLYEFPGLKDSILDLEENINSILGICGVINTVNHLVVASDINTVVLDPSAADLHVIHTSPGANRFIDVKITPKSDVTPHRHNCAIINKGPGTIVLTIKNRIDGVEVIRDKILKPYRKYDVSIISDGVHSIIY